MGIKVLDLSLGMEVLHSKGERGVWLRVSREEGRILGLYSDNGKENGNYYIIMRYIFGFRGFGRCRLLTAASGSAAGRLRLELGSQGKSRMPLPIFLLSLSSRS